jgi:hypothetical protein
MKEFIISQIVITYEKQNEINMEHFLRHVIAENKVMAIGKFALETQYFPGRKLKIECHELSDLKKIY